MKSQITDIDSGSFRKISYYLTSSDSNYICLNIKNKRIFLEFLENTYKLILPNIGFSLLFLCLIFLSITLMFTKEWYTKLLI